MSVYDHRSGRSFLVDCGADISVFPASSLDRSCTPSDALVAANGTPIKTWGTRNIVLVLGHGRQFTHEFQLAEVTQPILGADFFARHNLAIDMNGRRLLDLDHMSTVSARSGSLGASVSGIHAPRSSRFETIIDDFPEVLVPRFSQISTKHGVEHHIVTSGPPLHARARRLDADKLAAAKAEFARMESMGIIRRSNSAWASPLHIVPKADGGWRPCGDFRRLNTVTEDDRYPLPHIQDFNASLAGCTIFSKIDLTRGFHHIPVFPGDVPKTAVITPFGLWEFIRMPFGLKNAAQAFQRLMDGVLRGISFTFVYLDDILVASSSEVEHANHLRTVFGLLRDNGLCVNRKKCAFGLGELDYLGHRVSAAGIAPLPSKVEAVAQLPTPTSKLELQRFLGMINYYHRFLPKVAGLLAPLHEATKGKGKHITWTLACQTAFDAAKSALAAATLLHHPSRDASSRIVTDASDFAIGAAFEQQEQSGTWRPIAFFSRKLSSAEQNYSAFDRELLAIFASIKHFRHHVEGRAFHVRTDHKPLTFALSGTADRSPRQTRHLSFIAEFTTDLRHIDGAANIVADTLSRAPIPPNPELSAVQLPTIDYPQLAADQATSEEIAEYRTAVSGLRLADVPFDGFSLLCDISTGSNRPVIPREWTKRVFEAIHGLSHAGPRPTQRAVSSRFVWRRLKADVRRWCAECHACQSSKIQRHIRAPLKERPPPDHRFSSLHVDLVGPLPVSEGMTYLFTIVDRFTRWPEAIPIPDATAATCSRALIRHWITRFGVPADITSDRGPQFTSQLWTNLNKLLGISASTTTAYHPQANGLVERMHRQLKAALKARLTGHNWMDELPLVLLGMRTTWREGSNCSPADLVYGTALHLPGEALDPSDRSVTSPEFLQQLQTSMRHILPAPVLFHGANHLPVHMPTNLASTGFVYVRDAHRSPLQRPYSGPFRILEKHEKYFVLDMNGKTDSVSVDRLKVAHGHPSLHCPSAGGGIVASRRN